MVESQPAVEQAASRGEKSIGAAATRVYGQKSFTSRAPSGGELNGTTLAVPEDLAADAKGGLYVADTYNNRVVFYPSNSTTATRVYGQPSATETSNYCAAGASAFCSPIAVAIAPDGSLFVADLFNARVLMFPKGSNEAARVYGQPDMMSVGCQSRTDATSLCFPVGLATDAVGDLYVSDAADSRVLFYPAGSTTATRVYGQPGFTSRGCITGPPSAASLCGPSGLAVDAAGDLLIADQTNNRVLRFPAGSTTASQVYGQSTFSSVDCTVSATGLCAPLDVAAQSDGHLYVTDIGSRIVIYPAGSQTATGVIGQFDLNSGSPDGCINVNASELCGQASVATSTAGLLYAVDFFNNRVLSFPKGSNTAIRVYGQPDFTSSMPNHQAPDNRSLTAPASLALGADSVYVVDSQASRALAYTGGSVAASTVYGQPGFNSLGCLFVAQSTLCGPEGAATDRQGDLYVADSFNNRVLRYPRGSTTPSVVYGEPDFDSLGDPFCIFGGGGASASTMCLPSAVGLDSSNNLYVVDSGNHRVLFFPSGSTAPTRVYGQPSFTTNLCNGGGVSAQNMCVPSGMAIDASDNLYLADTGNNRVLVFPSGSASASAVYGQPDFQTAANDCDMGGGTNDAGFCFPLGVAVDAAGGVYVADSGNSRVLKFRSGATHASEVFGQPNFTSGSCSVKVSARTMCVPNNVVLDAAGNLFVADTFNARILLIPGSAAGARDIPSVASVSPRSGDLAGGNAVTIRGKGLAKATAVDFGTTRTATGLAANASGTSLTVTVPLGSGMVHVTVETPDGGGSGIHEDSNVYTYGPDPNRYVVFLDGFLSTGSEVRGHFARFAGALDDLLPTSNVLYYSYSGSWSARACGSARPSCPSGSPGAAGSVPAYGWLDTQKPVAADVAILDTQLGAILAAHPSAQIDLVGYSLGGIVALDWLLAGPSVATVLPHVHSAVVVDAPVRGIAPLSSFQSLVAPALGNASPDLQGSGLAGTLSVVPTWPVPVFAIENSADWLDNGEIASGGQGLFSLTSTCRANMGGSPEHALSDPSKALKAIMQAHAKVLTSKTAATWLRRYLGQLQPYTSC